MRRQSLLAFIIILSLFLTVGCQKSEAEIRAELKAEMASETKSAENNAADTNALLGTAKSENDEIVYPYLKSIYPELTPEAFNLNWNLTYSDITREGHLDVAIVDTSGYSAAIFLTSDSGKIEPIKSDEIFTESNTTIEINGDFIIIHGTPHGSGLNGNYIDIAYFDGNKVKLLTHESLYTDYRAGNQSYQEGAGTITLNNGYSDFNYSYQVKSVDANGAEKIISVINLNYAFNPDTAEYERGQIGENFSELDASPSTTSESTSSTSITNDYHQGYDVHVKKDQLYITYHNTGNEEVLLTPIEIDYATPSSFDPSRIYFTTKAKPYQTYYYNLNSMSTVYINDGQYVTDLKDSPYEHFVVLAQLKDGSTVRDVFDDRGQFYCTLGVRLDKDLNNQISLAYETANSDLTLGSMKLTGFENEIVNDTPLSYENYSFVLMPWYTGINQSKLTTNNISFSDNPNNTKITFAVLGTLKNVSITYYGSMDSIGEVENVGDVSNQLINAFALYSSDVSHIKIKGTVDLGEGFTRDVDYVIDTVRDYDQYEILAFE
ncbi:hypothetical protein [Fusibacter sp. 3D3]|uniref:hypothetical protein n=1 Tax=Fusibacter sp. 3D3 TaxID=1048380 RepID=UPI00085378A1|nr:hypothetical protein [Fusibacter sp. 3D3]GAU75679.1 hypothetical protein F3D3_0270 [Fusibacter sp. 3D3]